ncbi:hypothetical protein VDGD_05963 [Verticillium dahliae]|nr:hypothetical protein VDGD_05963 [Verticillium dahliae]
MSLAPILAARGVESFPGTCKIDISAKIEGCGAGVEIIIGGGNYHVEPKPDYIYITPTKPAPHRPHLPRRAYCPHGAYRSRRPHLPRRPHGPDRPHCAYYPRRWQQRRLP